MIKSSSHCVPDRENNYKINKTCLSTEELLKKKTVTKCQDLKNGKSKCTLEYEIDTKHLKPKKPKSWEKNEREWLSTLDIDSIMNMYSNARLFKKKYDFIATCSIDFQGFANGFPISTKMHAFIQKFLKGVWKKETFGVVFNLDKHMGQGTHWVSMFCNVNPKSPKFGAFYYDSLGKIPPPEIHVFFEVIKSKVNDAVFQLKWSKDKHQFANSECGLFSMMFIILCLENPDESFDKILTRIPKDRKDDRIFELRSLSFRD